MPYTSISAYAKMEGPIAETLAGGPATNGLRAGRLICPHADSRIECLSHGKALSILNKLGGYSWQGSCNKADQVSLVGSIRLSGFGIVFL